MITINPQKNLFTLKDNLGFIVMFFIYSLSLEDSVVKLYDFCRTKDGVTDLLDTVARNFIRHEEGERRAESPYRDDTTDVTDEGYFLRHSADKPDQIDVYLRKTTVEVGRVWNSYDIHCVKIMLFSVTEAALGLPIECTGKGVTTQTFNSSKDAQHQVDHLDALKERLKSQRAKVDEQIKAREGNDEWVYNDMPPLVKIDSDSESDNDSGNPIVRLRERINAECASTIITQNLDDLIDTLNTPLNSWSEKIDEARNIIDTLGSNSDSVSPLIPTPPPLPPSPVEKWNDDFVPNSPNSELKFNPRGLDFSSDSDTEEILYVSSDSDSDMSEYDYGSSDSESDSDSDSDSDFDSDSS